MLSIASINVQNKYKLKKYDGIYQGEDHVRQLLDLIQKHKLDIIGLQEVNPRYAARLQEMLDKKFIYYGKSRYPKNLITSKISYLETFNESVPLITNQKVQKKSTKLLPWISSYVPRIVTILRIEIKELGTITVLNTHLDNRKDKTKAKELTYLLKIISKIKEPVILMGDFNMTTKNKNFQKFIEEMKKINITHIDIGTNTFKNSKSDYAIDHIFLSNLFQIESIFLEKERKYQNFSDHYPLILKLRLGFSKN